VLVPGGYGAGRTTAGRRGAVEKRGRRRDNDRAARIADTYGWALRRTYKAAQPFWEGPTGRGSGASTPLVFTQRGWADFTIPLLRGIRGKRPPGLRMRFIYYLREPKQK